MFTIEAIKAAHAKVKSGADFPAYIRDLKNLGVGYYETWVTDGHTDYYGAGEEKQVAVAQYGPLDIAATANVTAFAQRLREHQQGATDYLTFCGHCAEHGVEKWVVCLDKMTCTYYDTAGNELLQEKVPDVMV
ncbi:uncharacterized protein YbcV (DUF1398 family) [Filimonas zeae]|uniref:Phage envelope protein n=1 Tax=Filimonas zeae TaxID=1737353 RepID=A0A917MVL5_9BACT|nr:DUF1398 family protein [Filimonas zeae]MDR6339506.1 uncharacterized protein YbcV (DUF1398 family) [Filimonas zeae]GGH63309.1 hypothetical protein GCM10011379_14050 [Filimonas zeae]